MTFSSSNDSIDGWLDIYTQSSESWSVSSFASKVDPGACATKNRKYQLHATVQGRAIRAVLEDYSNVAFKELYFVQMHRHGSDSL
jgi:hypothetical protein